MGHQTEENHQSTAKSISSDGGQDTWACQNSGYSSHSFPRKSPETPNLVVSMSQSGAKMTKIAQKEEH